MTYKSYRIGDSGDGSRFVNLADNWTSLPDEARQVQKLPHHDWPLVGGLIRSLETSAAKAAQ